MIHLKFNSVWICAHNIGNQIEVSEIKQIIRPISIVDTIVASFVRFFFFFLTKTKNCSACIFFFDSETVTAYAHQPLINTKHARNKIEYYLLFDNDSSSTKRETKAAI